METCFPGGLGWSGTCGWDAGDGKGALNFFAAACLCWTAGQQASRPWRDGMNAFSGGGVQMVSCVKTDDNDTYINQ